MRASVAATLVVALFLAMAAVAFVVLQRHQLVGSFTGVARQQASDVADRVAQQGVAVDLVGGAGDRSLIQVVDRNGTVVAASPSVEGEAPVVALRPRPGQVLTARRHELPIGEGQQFVVIARGTMSPDGPMVVLAAQSLEAVQRTTAVAAGLLVVGYPLVLLAVALTSYWLTGRALAPVEAIRRRVAAVQDTTELSARVPVPGGDDEIARLAQTMNSMLARLETGVEAQRRFVGDASHELRSPLATIRAAHEIGTLHPGAADWTDTSRGILDELDRVDRLVADLLLLARADERALGLQVVDVDLDDLVGEEAARLRRTGVAEVVVTGAPVRVRGDRERLARLLRNLCDNAARHAERRIEIRLRVDQSTASVEVIDDGSGVPDADHDRIFDRFVRLDESRARDSGGVGLGLPIARQIARAHHGDLRLERAGTGAHFVLTMPVAEGNHGARSAPEE